MMYPTACTADRVTANTVRLQGIPISLSKVAEETDIDIGYLSRIFSGRSNGSVMSLRKISRALGMSMEQFMDALPAEKVS